MGDAAYAPPQFSPLASHLATAGVVPDASESYMGATWSRDRCLAESREAFSVGAGKVMISSTGGWSS